jgi:hypothetical protein
VAAARRIRLLQWALAGVLGLQGLALAFHDAAVDAEVPAALRVALGLAEAGGALLFLLPRTVVAGGWVLAAALATAAGVHLGLGLAPPLAYVVYLAAIAAVGAGRHAVAQEGARHE